MRLRTIHLVFLAVLILFRLVLLRVALKGGEMKRISLALVGALLAFLPLAGLAQSPPSPSLEASTIITQAIRALTGSSTLTDVTLQGQATYIAGSDHETGTATLEATARNESSITLNLSGGTREWLRGWSTVAALSSAPAGVWTGPDGQSHAMALHNCWTSAAWFFPAFLLEASAAGNPEIALADLGVATKLGAATEHLQISQIVSGQSAKITAELQRLSMMDIYLDASSFLPLALDFYLHPDNDAGRKLPVEIRFSDYRSMAGIRAPFHIQEYLQGSLLLDIQVTSVTVNTGLADSAFALPAITGGQP